MNTHPTVCAHNEHIRIANPHKMITTKLLLNNWNGLKSKNHQNKIDHLGSYAVILTVTGISAQIHWVIATMGSNGVKSSSCDMNLMFQSFLSRYRLDQCLIVFYTIWQTKNVPKWWFVKDQYTAKRNGIINGWELQRRSPPVSTQIVGPKYQY